MATTVASILSRAAVILQDPTNIRWPQAELLDWLNEGQREVALFKPNVFTKNTSQLLVTGTKQALPSDALTLVDVVRNLGTDGATPGPAVRAVAREIMDAQSPNWHLSTASTTVKHYVYTPLDPKNYYVWPPQPTGATRGYVELVYTAQPTDASLGGNITLDDVYSTPLTNYILYRAYSKDAEYAANPTLAAAYYQAFQGQLQGKVTAEGATNPNSSLAPFNPNLPGGTK